MRSRWFDDEARSFVERYAAHGEDLALRVYTSRLIGAEPDLVLHGGGNTSVKSTFRDLLGEEVPAIFVKGSGWNLDTIAPEGLPGMDLAALRRLRRLPSLSDEEMVNQQRTHLFRADAPTPSVEALLHAFLPAKFVDHSHADAVLALTNRIGGEEVVRAVYGERVGIVPYVMPGFALSLAAAEAHDRTPGCSGLVLLKHGLFTWGETARESYERHVELVDLAERWLVGNRRRSFALGSPPSVAPADAAAVIAPLLRGRLAQESGDPDRPFRRMIVEWAGDEEVLAWVSSPDMEALARSNPLTPDHSIRTKPRPMIVANPDGLDTEPWTRAIEAVLEGYVRDYRAYFAAGVAARGERRALDPLPRVILVPGVGMFTAGASRAEARIAADIYRHTMRTKSRVHETGEYEGLPDLDLFDVEYWSLEQAKLGKVKEKVLARQVAMVTGAAGALGSAIAGKLLEAGCHVALLDRDEEALAATARRLAEKHGEAAVEAIVHDVTGEESTARAFAKVCRRFGGADVVVPNAGIARSGPLADLALADWRQVQEVNSTGVFLTLREAARLLRRQGTGGNVVVIASKNVFAPGAEFAAYSASKAAAAQLGKVAALELAADGIRVNSVNPDAIFGTAEQPSGLWREIGPDRARARGLEPADLADFYRRRSLLKVRLTGEHVGNAVVFFASNLTPTTGATLPVDAGLPEAFPR
ncbi:MAG TPA: bifunctional aldolase/short-chain dehydrogenase [Thermoanaerobaculia bacterium]|nr:bifunctional aldolase/short-chain dehydrogenase [Thermoanaerobaculia bacterium]